MDKIRSVLNSSEFILESISKPLLIYNIFVIALICYDATQLDIKSMGKNTFFLMKKEFVPLALILIKGRRLFGLIEKKVLLN